MLLMKVDSAFALIGDLMGALALEVKATWRDGVMDVDMMNAERD